MLAFLIAHDHLPRDGVTTQWAVSSLIKYQKTVPPTGISLGQSALENFSVEVLCQMTVGYVKSTKLTSRILTIKGIVTQENEDLEGVSKLPKQQNINPQISLLHLHMHLF